MENNLPDDEERDSDGFVLEVHIHDDEVAEAIKEMFERHPSTSMWCYERYHPSKFRLPGE